MVTTCLLESGSVKTKFVRRAMNENYTQPTPTDSGRNERGTIDAQCIVTRNKRKNCRDKTFSTIANNRLIFYTSPSSLVHRHLPFVPVVTGCCNYLLVARLRHYQP